MQRIKNIESLTHHLWYQPETYGAMEPREKIDIILEQVRLCLAKNDYIRAQLISKKVTPKAIENTEFQVRNTSNPCVQIHSSSVCFFFQNRT